MITSFRRREEGEREGGGGFGDEAFNRAYFLHHALN